jgi:hypothetical protein
MLAFFYSTLGPSSDIYLVLSDINRDRGLFRYFCFELQSSYWSVILFSKKDSVIMMVEQYVDRAWIKPPVRCNK